ncbi:hypothetical protein BJY52DRAFT_1212838 [Lactarius psammicola]|nr:hypothetical protein BJY52DRAFT_1212838 [Lactarius psammicola]
MNTLTGRGHTKVFESKSKDILIWRLTLTPTARSPASLPPRRVTVALPHTARRNKYSQSYASEFNTFPETSKADEALTAFDPGHAAAEEDDKVDLFDSDDEVDKEVERIKVERVAAYAAKKANKPKTIAKSIVTLEVKPWDDETDSMKASE